jgi:hypothetical protein
MLLGSALAAGCTDLKESPTSSITPENFYRTDAEVLGGVASVYAQLRATEWSYYNLSEVTTDEIIVPTRGQDWYDNGTWLELDHMSYTGSSPAGLGDVNGAWNDYFQGVARANVVLNAIADKPISNKVAIQSELRVLRAWYYYLLMDFFGGVPLVTTTAIQKAPAETRDSIFRFIETELHAARAGVPDASALPATSHGRVTKGVVDAILASMYVNYQVFNGTVSATGLTKSTTARWDSADVVSTRILNSGQYSLRTGALGTATDWRSNFTAANASSPENIFVIKHTHADGDLGINFVMRALHYNQFNPSPWNGFATIAEVYNAFDAADQRRNIFLIGLQVGQDPQLATYNQPVKDRQGNPLIFTATIADATQATEGEGARIMKWPPDPQHIGNQGNANDYAFFRLGEIYLMKAEAQNELGNTAAAITNWVNPLRARVGAPPLSPAMTQAQARTAIFQERMFELTGEGKRRQDMIRAGTYTSATYFNNTTARAPYKVLMPIPQTQLDNNSNLKQNPGY